MEVDGFDPLGIELPERPTEKMCEKGISVKLYYIHEKKWRYITDGDFNLIVEKRKYILFFCIKRPKTGKIIWKLIIQKPFSMVMEKGYFIVFRGLAETIDKILFADINTENNSIWGVAISKTNNSNRIFSDLERIMREQYPKLQQQQKNRQDKLRRESINAKKQQQEEQEPGIMNSIWNFFRSNKKTEKRMTISRPTQVKRKFSISYHLLSPEWKKFLFDECGLTEAQFSDEKVVKRVIHIMKKFERAKSVRMSVRKDIIDDMKLYESKITEMEERLKMAERESKKTQSENEDLQRKIRDLETKRKEKKKSLENVESQPLPLEEMFFDVDLPTTPIPNAPPIPDDLFDPDSKKRVERRKKKKMDRLTRVKMRPGDFTKSEKISMMNLIKNSMSRRRFQMEGDAGDDETHRRKRKNDDDDDDWSSGDEK